MRVEMGTMEHGGGSIDWGRVEVVGGGCGPAAVCDGGHLCLERRGDGCADIGRVAETGEAGGFRV